MAHYLDELNDKQKEAVLHINGPLAIIAGAGSGKTKVLTTRIAFLLEQGVEPYQILALTFTNKAAKEMVERVERMLTNTNVRSLFIGTFHAIFARILRAEADKIGYPSNFTIYDSDDSKNLLKSVIKDKMLDDKIYKPNVVLSRISAAKNGLVSPKEYAESYDIIAMDAQAGLSQIAEIYDAYCKACFKNGAMDFDDLLVKTYELLLGFPEILSKYQKKFQYIMIDEYQDTNNAQYNIMKLLAAMHENIVVVGDDAQSIYSFRGATIENILRFKKDYEDAKMVKLEQNYRSSKKILGAANAVIDINKNQIKKNLWTENDEGEFIQINKLLTDNEEGRFVASTIHEEKLRNHYANNEFAILYRTNAQSRAFEESLRRNNISYRIYGGLSFFQRKEIKDIIAYLRILVNQKDEEAIKRIINYPTRGIGLTTVQKLTIGSEKLQKPLYEILRYPEQVGVSTGPAKAIKDFELMLESIRLKVNSKNAFEIATDVCKQSGFISELKKDLTPEGQSRFENLQELLNSIQEFVETPNDDGELVEKDLGSYLQQIALLTDSDKEVEDDDTVKLMTIHAAKGLEFTNVFLVGVEENLFPSQRSMYDLEDLEEERRLFYVAITRAKKNLWITYANMRYRFGQLITSNASRFLNELPEEFVSKNSLSSSDSSSMNFPNSNSAKTLVDSLKKNNNNSYQHNSSNFIAQNPEVFNIGHKVEHIKFGFGEILNIEGGENNKMATIQFEKGSEEPKKIVLKFAKMRKVIN